MSTKVTFTVDCRRLYVGSYLKRDFLRDDGWPRPVGLHRSILFFHEAEKPTINGFWLVYVPIMLSTHM